MATPRNRPAAASGNGLSPQVIAVSVIVVVIAAVATIFLVTNGKKAPPKEEEKQVENPFEGLPPEPPPKPREEK